MVITMPFISPIIMIVYILLAVVLLSWFMFKFLIVPRQTYNYYAQIIPKLGYKLYKHPYKFWGLPLLEEVERNTKVLADATHSFKNKLVGYDVLLTNGMTSACIFLLNPTLIQHMNSAKVVPLLEKSTLAHSLFKKLASRSMLLLERDEWKQRRRLLSHIFTWDYLAQQTSKIEQICHEQMDKVDAAARSKDISNASGTIQFNLFNLMGSIFSGVVTSLFIGMDSRQQNIDGKPLNEAVLQLNDLGVELDFHPLVILFGAKPAALNFSSACRRFNFLFKAVRSKLRWHVKKAIKEHEAKQSRELSPQSIIEFMIDSMQGRPELQTQLVEQIFTFIMAGSDTTSSLTTAVIMELYQHPQVMSKVKQEIEGKKVGNYQEITPAQLKELKYLEVVMKEVNRLAGPTPFYFIRQPIQDVLIGDIPVKKGTPLNSVWKCHLFDPQVFEEPHRFWPQRWLQDGPKKAEMQAVGEMMFSLGPRTCIGKQLAYIEAKIVIINFLRRYESLKELQKRMIVLKQVTQYEQTSIEVKLHPEQ